MGRDLPPTAMLCNDAATLPAPPDSCFLRFAVFGAGPSCARQRTQNKKTKTRANAMFMFCPRLLCTGLGVQSLLRVVLAGCAGPRPNRGRRRPAPGVTKRTLARTAHLHKNFLRRCAPGLVFQTMCGHAVAHVLCSCCLVARSGRGAPRRGSRRERLRERHTFTKTFSGAARRG